MDAESVARRVAEEVRRQIDALKTLGRNGEQAVSLEHAHQALMAIERVCDDIAVESRGGPSFIGARP